MGRIVNTKVNSDFADAKSDQDQYNTVRPTIRLKTLIEQFYEIPENGAGGCLHLVLDDGNVEDRHLAFCQEMAEEAGDKDALAILERLWPLTVDRRRDLYLSLLEYVPMNKAVEWHLLENPKPHYS